MAIKRKARRKKRRAQPPVRRAAQPQVMVGGALDGAEKAASHMAAGALAPKSGKAAPSVIRRAPTISPKIAPGSAAAPAPKTAQKAVRDMGAGRSLSQSERGYFEPRLKSNLSGVRVHEGMKASRATRALDARAFAHGRDVALSDGARDRATLGHELSHVVQGGDVLRRDLAIEPSNPDAQARVLTEQDRAKAMRYNQRRFEDPFTISTIRDVAGIAKWPAVIDDDFIDATLRWQATNGLTQDGMFGPDTTATLVAELRAEGAPDLARQLRADNYVRVQTINGPQIFQPPNPANAHVTFNWRVGFKTSLRNGFIVQHIRTADREIGAPTPRLFPVFTPSYWEVWSVNGAGTVSPGGPVHDTWQSTAHAGTRGTFRMWARLYTVLHLPSMFAGPGQANHAPESGTLQSSLTNPGSNRLGLPEGYIAIEHNEGTRSFSNEWDATHANPALHWNRRT